MKPFPVDFRLTQPLPLHAVFEIRGFTALLGRSGAGKTSLLKALAGLLPAAGTPWANLPPERRPIGYVPQNLSLFPHLTVLQNAAFALTGPSRLAVAAQLLESLGIAHLAARPAAHISGGEAQRAALARALATNPDLLLLDEPSAALDSATRDAVLAQLIDTIARTQKPALAATHDFAVAALADWVVLLSNGQVIQQGPPRQVFAQPKTAEAARLLGYQNIFTDGGQTFAIRAEDIERAQTGRPATITSLRAQGAFLRLTCGENPSFVLIMPAADPSGLEPGQTLHLHFPATKLKILADEPETLTFSAPQQPFLPP